MPRKTTAAPMLIVLKNVVLTQRRLLIEVALLLLNPEKEKEAKAKTRVDLAHRRRAVVRKERRLEVPAPRERRTKNAAKNGRRRCLANMVINANYGMLRLADSLLQATAGLAKRARSLT